MRIRVLCAVLAVAVFSSPLSADHLTAKRPQDAKQAAKVASKLETLGMEPAAAAREVKLLTDRELAYFSATERVQVVGAQDYFFSGESNNLWYETLLGCVALAGSGTAIYFALNNHE